VCVSLVVKTLVVETEELQQLPELFGRMQLELFTFVVACLSLTVE
jgi:hypothetical protein